MGFLNSKKAVIALLSAAIIYGIASNIWRYYHFDKHSKFTIGNVTSFKYQGANTFAIFYFYKDGMKIIGSTYLEDDVRQFWINKYFKVKYSSKNPEINEIFIDEMVNDTLAIKAAGFKFRTEK